MEAKEFSLREIYKTLELCNYCARMIGLSFTDAFPSSMWVRVGMAGQFAGSVLALMLLVAAEIAYVASLVIRTTSVEEFVATLHIVGYGFISCNKLLTLWFKRHTFRKLLTDLAEIWPASCENREEENIKQESLKALRLVQIWYTFFNVVGVVMYNVTPIGMHLYRKALGQPSDLGYVWHATYPFDKTKYHEFVYAYEAFSGTFSVCGMLSSDMIFTTMASHISMLLRLLQVKIRRLAANAGPTQTTGWVDCYPDIVKLIKIHQRLISYSSDLEDTFSFVNLINVLLSSVNICCVVFVIVLLEPWMDLSNKLFLGAAMTQVGILCWYADDICRAISKAVIFHRPEIWPHYNGHLSFFGLLQSNQISLDLITPATSRTPNRAFTIRLSPTLIPILPFCIQFTEVIESPQQTRPNYTFPYKRSFVLI